MMMVLKRKEILVSALIVLIGAAALVNYNYNKNAAQKELKTAAVSQIESEAESYSVSAIDDENVRMMGEAQQVNASTQEVDYFSQAKLSRESARGKKLEILNEVVNNDQSDEESKNKAQQDILKTAEDADKEAVCENLIVAKGFEAAVVFINEESVTVTVKSNDFNDASALKIQEIITSNTGIETKYIKIVAV